VTLPPSVLCIDCRREGITARRKIVTPAGQPPRCTTHRRAKRASRSDATWEQHLMRTYGLTADEYWQIYESQDGVCYICRKARGLRRRLSVDHCHATGFVRGLLCGPCNKLLGHLRDDPEAFVRAAYYICHPPAFDQIGQRVAPIEEVRRAKLQAQRGVLPPGPDVGEPGGERDPEPAW
jgi:hypothetical protein